jgi:hypothetical protein
MVCFLLQNHHWWYGFAGIGLIFLLMAGGEQYAFIRKTVSGEIKYEKTEIIPVAKKVASITPENEYIISFQDDWYPDILLYAQRKGLIITPREEKIFTFESIAHVNYTTIIVVKRPLDAPEKLGIFDCFKGATMVEAGLYKVVPYSYRGCGNRIFDPSIFIIHRAAQAGAGFPGPVILPGGALPDGRRICLSGREDHPHVKKGDHETLRTISLSGRIHSQPAEASWFRSPASFISIKVSFLSAEA